MRTDAAFVSSLKACAEKKDLLTGNKLHVDIVRHGLVQKPYLASSLISMYAKCGIISKAQQIHDEFQARNVVTWNAMITGYARDGQALESFDCYERMENEGIFPNHVTFICILKACGITGAIDRGKQIHSKVLISIKDSMEKDLVMIGSALVDMYVKCGLIAIARKVHSDLPVRNVVTWSILIAGYVQQGKGHAALNSYEKMRSEGILPDAITFTCILKACGSIGASNKGKEIHEEVALKGLLQKDLVLGTALVDMYAKCGMLEKAREVLRELPGRDIVPWNALISGYAQHGQGHEALECFKSMREEGIAPDEVTFLSVLTACSHSGLLEDAQMCFSNMREKHNIVPNSEHGTCMVVVYGCVGQFDDAVSMIKTLPSLCDHPPVWFALLDACRKWGNVKLGALAFNQAIQVDGSSAAYALMASIYAGVGMMKDAGKVEALRLETLHKK